MLDRLATGSRSADAEIKAPSVENSELTNVLPLKPALGQNIAIYASSTARNFFLVLISTFLVQAPSFFSWLVFDAVTVGLEWTDLEFSDLCLGLV